MDTPAPEYPLVYRWLDPPDRRGKLCRQTKLAGVKRDKRTGKCIPNAGTEIVPLLFADGVKLSAARSAVVLADTKHGRQVIARARRDAALAGKAQVERLAEMQEGRAPREKGAKPAKTNGPTKHGRPSTKTICAVAALSMETSMHPGELCLLGWVNGTVDNAALVERWPQLAPAFEAKQKAKAA